MMPARPIPVLNGTLELKPSAILRHVHRKPGDTVILSGTLIEGIGNRFSDLDTYVLCDARPLFCEVAAHNHAFVHSPSMDLCNSGSDPVFLTMDYYDDTAFHLEVEYWPSFAFTRVIDKVERCHRHLLTYSDNNYSEFDLNRVEHLLLHRTLVGTVIAEGNIVPTAFAPELQKKYAYTLYRSIANFYWRFKDIAGALDADDPYLACELGREFLMREMEAFYHLRGCTNPTRKWLFTYWEKFCRPLDADLCELAISLVFAPTPSATRRYIDSIFNAVDCIERHNRRVTDADPLFISSENSLALLEKEASQRSHTSGASQEHEFAFRRRSYQATGPTYSEILASL